MRSRSRPPGTQGYSEHAAELIPRYEAISFVEHHQVELHLLPELPGRILDIGAGIGVDAEWFASRGHRVIAVEPTPEFRAAGARLYPSPNIEWLDDSLPRLDLLSARRQTFDAIMLSGVWMHLDEYERREAMPLLASFLARTGVLVLSLRHGPVPAGRRMFQVSAEETIELAERHGLAPVLNMKTESIQVSNRAAGVTWSRLAFKRAAACNEHGGQKCTPNRSFPRLNFVR